MRSTKAFTLAEAIVALIIIAIIAIAAFEFLRYCQRFIISSELSLMAVNRAREKMEDVYWDIDPVATTGTVTVAGEVWTRDVLVTDMGDYKVVKVTIKP